LTEAQKLASRLQQDRLNLGAVVVNQVHQPVGAIAESDVMQALVQRKTHPDFGQNMARAIVQSCADAHKRAEDESTSIQQALSVMPNCPQYILPRQRQDVHNLQSLATMARRLIQQVHPDLLLLKFVSS